MSGYEQTHIILQDLPPLTEGRICPKIYHAGYGRRAQFNDGQPLNKTTERTDENFIAYAEHFRRFGVQVDWLCREPGQLEWTAACGPYCVRVKKCGSEAEAIPQKMPEADPPVQMRLVLDLSSEAFNRYIAALEDHGFRTVWADASGQNHCAELVLGNRMIYAYHNAASREARFIDDPVSCRLDRFGSDCPSDGEPAELCQFALHYDAPISGVTMNCGMLYILKLPDRSFVLVDGGEYEQATEEAMSEILRVMRRMVRTAPGEKLRISAWICTHAHDDHMDVFSKFLRLYHDRISLERVIFNFPACAQYELMPETYIMLERLNRYFPDALYLKPHSGQCFSLAGVDFEILQTHEDGPHTEGDEPIGSLNDSSTVMKITFGGASLLLLGDIDEQAEARLLRRCSAATLHANAVQAAHHLVNRLAQLYPIARPDFALVPSYHYRKIRNPESYAALEQAVGEENMYFAEDGSHLFVPDGSGRLVLRECLPPVGGAYDGSDI